MSIELSNESFFEKMKDGFSNMKQTVVGKNGKNLAGVLAAVVLANSFGMGQANANEFDASELQSPKTQYSQQVVSEDVQEMRDYLDYFNTSYTSSEQDDMMLAGVYISDKTGQNFSNLEELVELTEKSHVNYLNRTGVPQGSFKSADYAEKVVEKAAAEGYSIDDLPNYVISGVDSIYPTYDELSPSNANIIVAKAESFYGELENKPYNTAEGAVETYMSGYASKVRNDGGVWSVEEGDITNGQEAVLKDLVSGLKSVSKENVDELPNYLIHKDTYSQGMELSSIDISDIIHKKMSPTADEQREEMTDVMPVKDVFAKKENKGSKLRHS